ncbi:MAG: DUF4881 domain-containing protein [Bryobacteraceae bacterium]|jgi:hypothetical protein
MIASLAVFAGCGGFGRVNQGQVIEYKRGTGLVTVIGDSNYRDPVNPRFDVLPPVTIRTPEDPQEMGPEPEAGKLLRLDYGNRRAVVFDASTQTLRTVAYMLISEQNDVSPADARARHTRFPVVDRTRKTITVYSPRDRKLVVFAVPEEYYALPDDTWKAGDEVRYYYKDPGRALRFMNVSKTDLNKAGK